MAFLAGSTGWMIFINTISKKIRPMTETESPFWIMVQKEISDHVKSWRVLILVALILLATAGSIYTVLIVIQAHPAQLSAGANFLYLEVFTKSSHHLPPFITFIGFL